MIKIELTVREAMNLANNCGLDVYEKIVTAFEAAVGENQRCTVTINRGLNLDNRIHCIKAIRLHTGWGLREAKDWTDVIVGTWDANGNWKHGTSDKNTLKLKSPEAATALLRDLVELGCEGFIT
jgi:ribosomal protein L7/L12